MTDRELMAKVSCGEAAAVEELVCRFRGPVFRYLRGWIRDSEDALDVTQEVMMRVVTKAHTYNGGPSLSGWIFTVTRNLHIDYRRRRNFKVHEGGVELADVHPGSMNGCPGPDVVARGKQVGRRVARAISLLPPRQQEVVRLRLLAELTLEEIASAAGLTVGGVKSTLHNALVRLRKELADLRESTYVEM